MQAITMISALGLANLILAASNLILAFSLFVYILAHNLWNSVARTFAALMGCVAIVYAGDVVLAKVASNEAAIFWLKFQWLGIAFVPAVYLHFSDALLRLTGAPSRRRRVAVGIAYGASFLFFVAALKTALLLRNEIVYSPHASQLTAGPYFWVFVLYFFLTSAWGLLNTLWARQRCLTAPSRRRMTYLAVTFAAPGMAVFPYLILASAPANLSLPFILGLSVVGNIGVATMTAIMAYSVAYQSSLAPDRVVKQSLILYLLRGPLLGTFVIGIALIVPRVEVILGVPRETFLIFAIVGGIVLYQVLLKLAQPLVDRLTYEGDRTEINWLQRVDERLLTSSEIEQLMENILTALCDLLRTPTGSVIVMRDGKLHTEAYCGSKFAAESLLQTDAAELLGGVGEETGKLFKQGTIPPPHQGYWFIPLRSTQEEATLGILAIAAPDDPPELSNREHTLIAQLIHQAEITLEDRRLQQSIFALLHQLTPRLDSVRQWRREMRYPGQMALDLLEDNPVLAPDFPKMVRDALTHYWGGPRLSESPLLRLRVVQRALREYGGNPTKALRAVLDRAIEELKPDGQRQMTAPEWTLYNILDLKYLRGHRVHDVANRLAISESDFYRKQRAAIDEVAKALAAMERRTTASEGEGAEETINQKVAEGV
jgi:hypothetical protein